MLGHTHTEESFMVPPESHPLWKDLIQGKKKIASTEVSLTMLMFNLQMKYKSNPSDANLGLLAKDAHKFFVKYENIMTPAVRQSLGI
jgi:hypothetical protein